MQRSQESTAAQQQASKGTELGPAQPAEPPKPDANWGPRLLSAAALAAIGALVLYLVIGSGGGGHTYRLMFENGGQMVKGGEVMIGGHPVGKVDSIRLTEDSQAEITITIDQELHRGSTAVIRATSLAGLANRYIAISPGPNSEPTLDSGEVIGPSDTVSPVDLDQVFDAFDKRTRDGLANFIQGQGAVFDDKGRQANRSYKYLEPALYQTNKVLDDINEDHELFKRFIVSGADVFGALADRRDDLAASVSNANRAFDAIATENESVDRTLELLAPTFRQSNTAFVNLRAALDDLDSLVETAKPATADLAPFLARARPVLTEATPVVTDFRHIVQSPGADNDLGELTALLPDVQEKAEPSFEAGSEAIEAFQPTLEYARPYAPEMLGSLSKLGQIGAYYDANGHYARAQIADLNIFAFNQATSTLEPLPASEQYAPFGANRVESRCPGATTQSAPDNSNPYYDPPWESSGLEGDDCNPSEVPPTP